MNHRLRTGIGVLVKARKGSPGRAYFTVFTSPIGVTIGRLANWVR